MNSVSHNNTIAGGRSLKFDAQRRPSDTRLRAYATIPTSPTTHIPRHGFDHHPSHRSRKFMVIGLPRTRGPVRPVGPILDPPSSSVLHHPHFLSTHERAGSSRSFHPASSLPSTPPPDGDNPSNLHPIPTPSTVRTVHVRIYI